VDENLFLLRRNSGLVSCVASLSLNWLYINLRSYTHSQKLPYVWEESIQQLRETSGAVVSCYCGPGDVSLSSLIGLGLQDLTVPPDLHIQGLHRLGCRLWLVGRVWLLTRAACLR